MQQSTRRVVVGVDGSEDGLRAVRYAMREALVSDSTLAVVSAVDDSSLSGAWELAYDADMLAEGGRESVAEAVAMLTEEGFPADRLESHVLLGGAAQVLVRCSDEADRLVVGRRSGGGRGRMFVGSTSVSVAAASRCPVIVISAATNPTPTGGKHHIGVAVGTDGPIRGTGAMGWACQEAATRGARLTVCHVVQPPPGWFRRPRRQAEGEQQRAVSAAVAQIEQALTPLRERFPQVAVDVDVTAAPSALDALVERSGDWDLLIVGAHSGGLGTGLGGVVRGVMAQAACPVGVIRSPRS